MQVQHVRSRKGGQGVRCGEEVRALGPQDGFCERLLHTHRQKGPPPTIVAMLHGFLEVRGQVATFVFDQLPDVLDRVRAPTTICLDT